MQGKQYLIIISSGKSGSYLTMGLLDWHPEVIVFPRQENLVTQWLSMQKKILYGNDASFGLKTLPFQEIEFESIRTYYTQNYLRFLDMSDGKSREIARKDGIDYSNIDYSILLSKISDARPKQDKITIIEWLDILFDAYKESVEKYRMRPVKYFVFKTIEPELFARYTDIFPEAKFIHLVRHPYDVFNAFKRNTIINKKLNYFRPDFDLLEYALEEKIKTLFENVNIADRNKNKHYILKYEDIVSDPKRTTMELSAWLGISWNDDMTKPTLAGKPFIAYSDNRIVKHEGVINTKRVNVFKETLGSSEIRFIDYLFTDEMKALKYDIKYGISNRSLALLLAGLIFPLKLELKNWKPYTIIGMLMRRCYMAHRIGRKFIERHKRK